MTYEEKITALAETAKEDGIESEEGRRIFAYLCSSAMDYHDAANVTPTRILMQALGYTKYRICKELSILKKLGLLAWLSLHTTRTKRTACCQRSSIRMLRQRSLNA